MDKPLVEGRGQMPGLEFRVLPRITRRVPRSRALGWLVKAVLKHYVGKTASVLVDADVMGCKMQLDPFELVDCALLLFPQYYDADELTFAKERLRPGDVFLDAGAHIGFYSCALAPSVGDTGSVLAIEPDPVNYRRLSEHVAMNDLTNVRTLNLGLSDQEETLRLGIAHGGNRAANTFLNPMLSDSVDVPCKPLHLLLQEQGVAKLHGAKFDIEGFEYKVLARYFEEVATAETPDFIIVEFHPEWLPVMGGNVLELLKSRGYSVRDPYLWNYIATR